MRNKQSLTSSLICGKIELLFNISISIVSVITFFFPAPIYDSSRKTRRLGKLSAVRRDTPELHFAFDYF